jgi:hypothetical protein
VDEVVFAVMMSVVVIVAAAVGDVAVAYSVACSNHVEVTNVE